MCTVYCISVGCGIEKPKSHTGEYVLLKYLKFDHEFYEDDEMQ